MSSVEDRVDDDDDSLRLMPLLVTFLGVFVITYVIMVRVFGWTLRGRSGRSADSLRHPPPPSMASLPVVGSLVFMTSCRGLYHRFFADKAKTLGPVFTCYLGSELALVLNDRRTIDEALLRKAAFFSGRTLNYTNRTFYNPKAKGIIGHQYNDDFRRYHQQALTILKEFGLGQNEMETRINREIDELIDQIDSKQGRPFDPADLVSLTTLNVVVSFLFAKRLSQTDPILRKLNNNLHRLMHSIRFFLTFCPFLRFFPPFSDSIRDGYRVLGEINGVIENGINSSLEDENTEESYVKSFATKEKEIGSYDEDDLCCACRDMMEAGSDTSATTILWSMELMANHPDIQKRLHDDIDAQLDPQQKPTSRDATSLPYVEATILEILRLRTVVPLAVPHKVVEDATIAGFHVVKGTMVLLNLYAVHMDEGTWGDPEVFRPNRFLAESGEKIVGKNRIIPFSIGKRSCLGEGIARQELFLMFTRILQRYEIRPPEGQQRIVCQPVPATVIAPSPFQVRLIPRNR